MIIKPHNTVKNWYIANHQFLTKHNTMAHAVGNGRTHLEAFDNLINNIVDIKTN